MNAFLCSRLLVLLTLLAVAPRPNSQAAETAPEYDVVVYGGTSAGVVAAVQAKRMGKTVIIVGPDKHLGGLTAGGLGWTDSGNKNAVGGISREFYQRIWQHYQQPEAWPWQKREEFGNRNQSPPAKDGDQSTMWVFEPHVAEKIYERLIAEHKIPVQRDQWLDRQPGRGVEMQAGRIVSITMLSGQKYRGRMFIDATYEGDLLAAAGVSYHVGREANAVYDETWNGIQVGTLHHGHWFKSPISPYVVAGDPSSGLLPRISSEPPGEKGAGDHRVQAYCYRMCLTNHDANRIPFPKPAGYDPRQYELLLRVLATGWREAFQKFDMMQNHKTDTNNHGPFSTDNIGMNYDYPEGSYERRREILAEHTEYQQGLMYFLANEPRVPDDVRTQMAKWGLPKDDFTDNGGWPHQIYVREARRMIGVYVMTEHDCLDRRDTPQSVGMGSYTMDSHNVQRYVTPEGLVQNEGDIGVGTPRPYEIAFGSLTPRQDQCENLLVPVCLSSSHIAYGSIRMEPVFMVLGQSAATAACLAIDHRLAVQELSYDVLRQRLLADGQVLELDDAGSTSVPARKLNGVVVDDLAAKLTGNWKHSAAVRPFVDSGYQHDGDENKGQMSAQFEAALKPGRYEVRIAYAPSSNRATNVPITIQHAAGTTTMKLNERETPAIDKLTTNLGTFDFGQKAVVIVSNEGTNGHVVIDAVQFVPGK